MSNVNPNTLANHILGDLFYQNIINILVISRNLINSPAEVAAEVAQSVVNDNPNVDDMGDLADLCAKHVFQLIGYVPVNS